MTSDKIGAAVRSLKAGDAVFSIQPHRSAFIARETDLLVRVPDASILFETLLTSRVLVKNVSKMHPLLANCVRLTVGSPDENAQLLAALKLVLH